MPLTWRQQDDRRAVLDRLLFGSLPILVIAGPYYLFELPGVVAYIYRGWVRERETWIPDLLHLNKMFYVDMATASFLYWFWIGAVGSIGIVVVAALYGDRKTALRFLGLIFVTLIAYIVPTSVEFKHFHWGGVFYGGIAVCLVLMLHFWPDRFEPIRLCSSLTAEEDRAVRPIASSTYIPCLACGCRNRQSWRHTGTLQR